MEFALVLPMLVLLVVGIAEFGRAYHVQTTVSGAAREGVRVMALENDASAARATVKSYASGLGLTDGQISVSPAACSTGADATVTISYPFDLITGFLGDDFTLTGKGKMRCNG